MGVGMVVDYKHTASRNVSGETFWIMTVMVYTALCISQNPLQRANYMILKHVVLLLISSLIFLWLEIRHCMISIFFFNLLSCILWPRMWFILVNVPCVLENHMYSAIIE